MAKLGDIYDKNPAHALAQAESSFSDNVKPDTSIIIVPKFIF
jgi:hypothetical protein